MARIFIKKEDISSTNIRIKKSFEDLDFYRFDSEKSRNPRLFQKHPNID